ncbi:MAG: biliverdin-producing heme oxygenase [Idiomarina sp.]|nr:biliverdin-producing heme oxygenase [Idiomarina sp.]
MSNKALLQKLREHTAKQHQQVESSAIMSKLVHPELTVGDYLAALFILASFIGRYETSLLHAFAKCDGYSYRPRLSLLQADINAISKKAEPVPEQSACLTQHSWYELIGVVYVIEGSTQGGKVLANRIERQLGPSQGLTASNGLSYFNLYQQNNWENFTRWLTELKLNTEQQAEVLRGARSAFFSLANMLSIASFDTNLVDGVR